jgi:hypothetical protein
MVEGLTRLTSRIVNKSDPFRGAQNPVLGSALEILVSLDSSTVLPNWQVQFHAAPVKRKQWITCEAHVGPVAQY